MISISKIKNNGLIEQKMLLWNGSANSEIRLNPHSSLFIERIYLN